MTCLQHPVLPCRAVSLQEPTRACQGPPSRSCLKITWDPGIICPVGLRSASTVCPLRVNWATQHGHRDGQGVAVCGKCGHSPRCVGWWSAICTHVRPLSYKAGERRRGCGGPERRWGLFPEPSHSSIQGYEIHIFLGAMRYICQQGRDVLMISKNLIYNLNSPRPTVFGLPFVFLPRPY